MKSLDSLITFFAFAALMCTLMLIAFSAPDWICKIFTFMDWNKPGAADDMPFCWMPGSGFFTQY